VRHLSLAPERWHQRVLRRFSGESHGEPAIQRLPAWRRFEHSLPHAENMLNRQINYVGVGVGYVGNAMYVTRSSCGIVLTCSIRDLAARGLSEPSPIAPLSRGGRMARDCETGSAS